MREAAVPDLHRRIDILRRILSEQTREPETREREILRLRLGIADGRSRTAEEVAEIFALSPARVRQIENRAIRRIRPASYSQKIRDFFRDNGKI